MYRKSLEFPSSDDGKGSPKTISFNVILQGFQVSMVLEVHDVEYELYPAH